jgi:hypothetical protein
MHAVYQWRNPKVNRFARSRFLAVAKFYTWNFARELQGDGFFTFGNVELKNYWTVFASLGLFRETQDDRGTRGGPSMLSPSAATGSIGVESDGRRKVSIGGNASFNRNEVGAWSRRLGLNVRYRPAASLEISAGPNFDRNHGLAQYVDAFADPIVTDTYGSRYVFSTLDQKEFSLQTRVNYVMSPKMSLQVYMQPLVSVGHYTGFKQFAKPRTFDFIQLDASPGSLTYDPAERRYTAVPADGGAAFQFDDPDFNFKSLRLNAIYRWEWRPGSAIYVVWTAPGRRSPRSVSAGTRSRGDVLGAGERRADVQAGVLVPAVRPATKASLPPPLPHRRWWNLRPVAGSARRGVTQLVRRSRPTTGGKTRPPAGAKSRRTSLARGPRAEPPVPVSAAAPASR